MRETGLDRLLRCARILSARDTPRFACGTAFALPAKNDSLNRFLNAETFSGSSPVMKKQPAQKYELFFKIQYFINYSLDTGTRVILAFVVNSICSPSFTTRVFVPLSSLLNSSVETILFSM